MVMMVVNCVGVLICGGYFFGYFMVGRLGLDMLYVLFGWVNSVVSFLVFFL